MRQWVLVLALAFVAAVDAQLEEESFTIFLDLDDFHVTQFDNHEFLHSDSIGEHDNVLLELSEAEVKHFMSVHDTHECLHPEDLHEVVSFIQEKMWTAPVTLDESMGTFSEPQAGMFPFGQMPAPFPQIQQAVPMQGWFNPNFGFAQQASHHSTPKATPPSQNAIAHTAPAAQNVPVAPKEEKASVVDLKVTSPSEPSQPLSVAAPKAETDSTPSVASDKVSISVDKSEEEAVLRFINAYHSFKSAPAQPALSAPVPAPIPAPAPAPLASAISAMFNFPTQQPSSSPSLLDSLMDEDDKRMLGMLSPTETAADQEMDRTISSAVDEALKHAITNEIPAFANMMGFGQQPAEQAASVVPEVSSEASSDESSHHHHHHHHHRRDDQQDTEPGQIQAAEAPAVESSPVAAPEPAPVAATPVVATASASVPAPEDPTAFTAEERQALKELLKEFAAKSAAPAAPAAAPVTPAPATPVAPAPATLPSTPAEVSHISKAPSPTEVIPESVYSQQLVDFNEKPKPLTHRVPKRILIPRMEEPGPVIGGSSRPVHIQLPPLDDMHGSSRPAAPAEIVAAAKAAAAAAAAKEPTPSIKAATISTETDEALTAPEVVIFRQM